MRPRLLAASLTILASAFIIVPSAEQATPRGAQPASSCDRRCLLQFLTDYTEALTDNDTSRLAVAPALKVTSNGAPSALGKGEVWGPARRLPTGYVRGSGDRGGRVLWRGDECHPDDAP